jgi:type II secretory pathway pseudopilin PulG
MSTSDGKPKLARQAAQILLALLAVFVCGIVFALLNSYMTTKYDYSVRLRQARRRLLLLRGQIESYRRFHRALPNSLMDLYVPLPEEVIHPSLHPYYASFGYDGRFDVDGRPFDAWGFPYRYATIDGAFELYTMGADGERGGVGVNLDLNSNDPPETTNRPTFRQLILLRGVRGLLMVAAAWGCFMLFMLPVYLFAFANAMRMRGSMLTWHDERLSIFWQVFAIMLIISVIMVFLMTALGSAHDAKYLRPEPPSVVA